MPLLTSPFPKKCRLSIYFPKASSGCDEVFHFDPLLELILLPLEDPGCLEMSHDVHNKTGNCGHTGKLAL